MKSLNNVTAGTLGGTFCSIYASISLGEAGQTILLSALGSIVSYLVSSWLGRKKNKH